MRWHQTILRSSINLVNQIAFVESLISREKEKGRSKEIKHRIVNTSLFVEYVLMGFFPMDKWVFSNN